MLIKRRSIITFNTHEMEIDVTQDQLDRWQCGMLIQDAMPQLTDSEREFIKTGITPEEWDTHMKGDDDE